MILMSWPHFSSHNAAAIVVSAGLAGGSAFSTPGGASSSTRSCGEAPSPRGLDEDYPLVMTIHYFNGKLWKNHL